MAYAGLKSPKPLADSALFRVTDFSNLTQFNLYQSGYQLLLCCKIPKFMDMLTDKSEEYALIVDSYKTLIEREFKSLDGLEDMTSEYLTLDDGINQLNMISKVNEPTSCTVNITYTEKSGLPIYKYHRLYLTGIKDPKAKYAKHYHGLIQSGDLEDDWANEVGIFLYIITDQTYLKVENAYLLLAAYPTTAETSMFNGAVGDVDKKEVTIPYNCFPVTGEAVFLKAQEALNVLLNKEDGDPDKLIVNSDEYHWKALDQVII